MRRVVAEIQKPRPALPIGVAGVARDSATLAGWYVDAHGRTQGPVTCLKCVDPACEIGPGDAVDRTPLCPVNAVHPPIGEQPATIAATCIGCGLCAMRCPVGAISISEGKAQVISSGSTVLTQVVSASDQRDWLRGYGLGVSGVSENDLSPLKRTLVDRAATLKSNHFYPLVASLFRAMGIPAYAASLGVNNERIDVVLPDSEVPIPAEVKSATEVPVINAKSVQQALENKLTISRDAGMETMPEGSSLAIGFEDPPSRSGVMETIANIRTAYGVEIATVTTSRLYSLAIQAALGAGIDRALFARAQGSV